MTMQLQDRRVLITGASGGLGGAVTRAALEAGAHVTAVYRAAAGSTDGTVQWVQADVADEAQVAAVVDGMERVDALIHLVGGFTMAPTHEQSLEGWRSHHDLTLTTTFLCCKHALRRMRDSGYGRIVTVGSRAAVEPMKHTAAYASAKAGVVALTRVIAAENRDMDITANCVLPSIIDTPANRQSMGDGHADRWVTPESLAHTIVELASDHARDIRGAALPIYGRV